MSGTRLYVGNLAYGTNEASLRNFFESVGEVKSAEVVIDRAMAASGAPVSLDDLKIIILMVFWSFGQEPDALVLDELCDDSDDRVAH